MTGRRAFVAAVTALALSLAACGGGSGDDHPSGGRDVRRTRAATGAAAAKQALCNDLLLIQSGFRPDALDPVPRPAEGRPAAFVSAGDKADAKQVALGGRHHKLRQALLNQKGVQQAQQAFAKAIDKLPAC